MNVHAVVNNNNNNSNSNDNNNNKEHLIFLVKVSCDHARRILGESLVIPDRRFPDQSSVAFAAYVNTTA